MEEYKVKVAKYPASRDNYSNIVITFSKNFVQIPEGNYEIREACAFDDNGSFILIKPSKEHKSKTNDVKCCSNNTGVSRFMFKQNHDYFDNYIGLYELVRMQREHGQIIEIRLYRQNKIESNTGLLGNMTGKQRTVKNTPKPVHHREPKPEKPVETPVENKVETPVVKPIVDAKVVALFNSLIQTVELFAIDNDLNEEYNALENIRNNLTKKLAR